MGEYKALRIKTKDEFINVNKINEIINDRNKNILIKLKYATTDNFMGMDKPMYPTENAWLHPDVADALIKANNFLYWISGKKYRLCLYDAGRPIDVQEKMFNKIQNKDWIDDPNSPSTHNFGLAVDVTIVDENGNELNMGTQFNEFKDKSKIIYEELYIEENSYSTNIFSSQQYMMNRRLLRRAMCEYGFLTNENKWWHFEFVSKEYAIKNKFPKIKSYTKDGDFILEEIKLEEFESNEINWFENKPLPEADYFTESQRKKLKANIRKSIKNNYIVLHHTAGHANPIGVVEGWREDKKGSKVATEFVVGGPDLFDGKYTGKNPETGENYPWDYWDGKVIRAFPEASGIGYQSYHPGAKVKENTNASYMNVNSVGIEICNFGYIEQVDKDYGQTLYKKRLPKVNLKSKLKSDQIVHFETAFRGYHYYHKYSKKQINQVRNLLIYIARRDGIDLSVGLQQWLIDNPDNPAAAFEYNKDAANGNVKGLITHTNIIKNGKWDCSPQEDFIKMILSLPSKSKL